MFIQKLIAIEIEILVLSKATKSIIKNMCGEKMADNLMYLKCKECGEKFAIAKYYVDTGWYFHKDLKLYDEWLDKHRNCTLINDALYGKSFDIEYD